MRLTPETARKLFVPVICAIAAAAGPATATAVPANQLGQTMSGGKATATPQGQKSDSAGPLAGAGTGRRIR